VLNCTVLTCGGSNPPLTSPCVERRKRVVQVHKVVDDGLEGPALYVCGNVKVQCY